MEGLIFLVHLRRAGLPPCLLRNQTGMETGAGGHHKVSEVIFRPDMWVWPHSDWLRNQVRMSQSREEIVYEYANQTFSIN